jgi:hypothetical protein
MTENMISPADPLRNALAHEAERSAAFVTAAVTGARRAVTDLAADRAGELVVSPRRRNIDLSTPAGRIRYGYLGGEARNALAELFEALDEVDTAELPLGLVASREAARQVLRLAATVDDVQLPDCPRCSTLDTGLQELGEILRSANVDQAAVIEPMRGQL